MKYILFTGILCGMLWTGAQAHTNQHDAVKALVSQLSELNETEKSEVFKQLSEMGSRIAGLPQALQDQKPALDLSRPQAEMPKHKSTNLSIAPPAAITCGLPHVYSSARHGKEFLLYSAGLGLMYGLLSLGIINFAFFRSDSHPNAMNIATPVSVALAAIITMTKFKSLKNSYLANEERILADFFSNKWEVMRKHLALPEYVTTRINYLADKFHGRIEGATFDMQEAREFLAALCEPTRA